MDMSLYAKLLPWPVPLLRNAREGELRAWRVGGHTKRLGGSKVYWQEAGGCLW